MRGEYGLFYRWRLVESYRDKQTGKVHQRTISNFFKLDGAADKKIVALKKFLDIESGACVAIEGLKDFGDVFLLQGNLNQLHLDGAFRSGLQLTKRDVPKVIFLTRLMVFHWVCDPGSKLGCLMWLETADVPGRTTHQHLLRAMDALIRNLDNIERALDNLLHPLLDCELTLAIYDLTTVRIHGEAEVNGDIRKHWKSKDTGGIDRQLVLGLVQTEERLPLMQQVHDGKVAETKTLTGMIRPMLGKYPIRRVVAVADRGLLSEKNVKTLIETAEAEGRDL